MVETVPDVFLVGGQLGFLRNQSAVYVPECVTPLTHQLARLLHKNVRTCTFPLRVVVREDLPDVWERQCTCTQRILMSLL